jgi:flavin reductase (DIM6/NTAB) family NADH-FMN oxidoreductase RutF
MDEQAKSALLHKIPYGLYVLAAVHGEDRGAMLVTWVMQASFGPPLVAAAVQRAAHTTAVLRRSGAFALSFMSDDQRKVAGSFGQEYEKVGDKLARHPWRPGPATGAPVLDGALGVLECRVRGWLEGGDHDIVLGEIVGAELRTDAPLMTTASSGMSYAG